MLRVDPNCVISRCASAPATAASVSPGPSCPNRNTHRSGIAAVSMRSAPGGVVDRHDGSASSRIAARNASTSGWYRTCWYGRSLAPRLFHRRRPTMCTVPARNAFRAAHDRPDVQVVLPVLDRHVEPVPTGVELGDDRVHRPVAEPVDDVAGCPGGRGAPGPAAGRPATAPGCARRRWWSPRASAAAPRVVAPVGRSRRRDHGVGREALGHATSVRCVPRPVRRPASPPAGRGQYPVGYSTVGATRRDRDQRDDEDHVQQGDHTADDDGREREAAAALAALRVCDIATEAEDEPDDRRDERRHEGDDARVLVRGGAAGAAAYGWYWAGASVLTQANELG